MSDLVAYSVGLMAASVCVPKGASATEIEEEMNRHHPTGIDPDWKLSGDPTFANGAPNPCPCEQDPDRLHYLLHC